MVPWLLVGGGCSRSDPGGGSPRPVDVGSTEIPPQLEAPGSTVSVVGVPWGVRDLSCAVSAPDPAPGGVTIRWWVDGAPADLGGPRVRADRTAPGQAWRCEAVVPSADGTSTSTLSAPWVVPTPVGGNVLVVVLDDVGVDRIADYGLSAHPASTPRLHALAEQGARFETVYASPACSTSRAWLLTGRYGLRYGLLSSLTDHLSYALPDEEVSLAELWSAARPDGATAAFGKWHLATSDRVTPDLVVRHGFDAFRGTVHNLPSYAHWQEFGFDGALRFRRAYPTDRVGADAIDFVTTAPEPWLAWVAFHAPHAPYDVVPDPSLAPVSAVAGVTLDSADPKIADAMLEGADTELGRILDAMDPEVLGRTTVVVLGDNGTAEDVARAPLDADHAKSSVYEGGVRVPMVVAGRAVRSGGGVVPALTEITDLFPTVADLLGWPVVGGDDGDSRLAWPDGDVALDGRSFLPLLQDADLRPPPRTLLSFRADRVGGPPYEGLEMTARDQDWKLVRRDGHADELYAVSAHELAEGADRLAGPPPSPAEREAWDRLSAALDDFLVSTPYQY